MPKVPQKVKILMEKSYFYFWSTDCTFPDGQRSKSLITTGGVQFYWVLNHAMFEVYLFQNIKYSICLVEMKQLYAFIW